MAAIKDQPPRRCPGRLPLPIGNVADGIEAVAELVAERVQVNRYSNMRTIVLGRPNGDVMALRETPANLAAVDRAPKLLVGVYTPARGFRAVEVIAGDLAEHYG